MSTSRTALPSSPANPAELRREISGLIFTLNTEGLTVAGLPGGPLHFDPAVALAVSDFLRSPGARSLVARAWLAEQHAAALVYAGDDDTERRHKRHAGLTA